jgi:hypothetical protein
MESVFTCFSAACWANYVVIGHSEDDHARVLKAKIFCHACGGDLVNTTHLAPAWNSARKEKASTPQKKPLPPLTKKWESGQAEFDFMRIPQK